MATDNDLIPDLLKFVGQAKAVNLMKRAADEIKKLRALDAKRQDEWIALNRKLNEQKNASDQPVDATGDAGITDQVKQLEQLIDDLSQYVDHRFNCAAVVDGKKLSCSCGLAAVMNKVYYL